MRVATALLLLLAVHAPAGSPAEAVRAALADCQRQPASLRKECRYLSLYPLPAKYRAEFLQILSFHINSLSRESEIVRPTLVAPDLVRLQLFDYGLDPKVWEKLATVDPYFHVQLVKNVIDEKKEIEDVLVPLGVWKLKSTGETVTHEWGEAHPNLVRWENTTSEKRRKEVIKKATRQETISSSAPWLPPTEIAALIVLTGSEVPLVRADWFVAWTAIQAGRKGSGYYDFLGLKKRDDAEKLAGLDKEAARRLRKEIAALVSESGVALNNRQILRYQSLTGGFWITLDSNTSVAKQNALSLLDGDFVHDAEEIYFVLPNSLFGLVASNANGVLQETVPDTIAGHKLTRSNDTKIHPGLSCIECHVTGLQPIDDWSRSVYQGPENPDSPIVLAAVDPKKLKRLRQLYLAPLKTRLKKDIQEYADALLLTNGLSPEKNAAAYAAEWYRYSYTSLGQEETAIELGVTKTVLLRSLKTYVAPQGVPVVADPILVGFLGGRKIRREHFEERYALMHQILTQGR